MSRSIVIFCHTKVGKLRASGRGASPPQGGSPAAPFWVFFYFHILNFGFKARFLTLCMVHCPAWWDWNTANSNIPLSVVFKIWLTMSDFRDSDSEDSSDRPVQVMASRNFHRSASFSNLLSLQGPMPYEPEDAPWKRNESSGIRKL